MLGSLFSAVSGLQNLQTGMDVIGNNIANVNTTGFKAGRATYKESFAQVLQGATRPSAGLGGTNATEVGLGSQLGSIDTIFTQGTLQTTGVTTDMAVQGNSFFVVNKNGQQLYTREGNFQVDGQGNLVSPLNGGFVQGLMATNGVIGGSLTNISIPAGQTVPARATTSASFIGNLDASAPNITAVDPNNPTAAEFADPANASSVVQTTLSTYDSLGVKHDLTVDAWKTSATQWDFKIDPSSLNYDNTKPYTLGPGAASSPAGAATPWQFTFNSDGTINTTSSNIPTVTYTPSGGGAAVSIKIDPGTGATGLTSSAATTTAVLSAQDGYSSGVLQKISVGSDGVITGSFSNGTNQALAQVALADFNNPEGVANNGDNMFTSSANSGDPVIGYAGKTTSSTIAGGTLEMSNVDLASEFTNMIVTQRGFEANGKMITTSDQMLQDLVNLIR